MMKISRRQLARYAADQIAAGIAPGELAARLGSVLVATKRPNQAMQLIDDINYELEVRGIWAQATVTTAFPLSDELKAELQKFIKNSSSVKSVDLHQRIDQTIIGGIRLDTATKNWDQTIKKRLTDIREAF